MEYAKIKVFLTTIVLISGTAFASANAAKPINASFLMHGSKTMAYHYPEENNIVEAQDRSHRPIVCDGFRAPPYPNRINCNNHQKAVNAMMTIYYQVNNSANPTVRAYANACRDAINLVSSFPQHLRGDPTVIQPQFQACNAALQYNGY